jgi:hypothetical protein
VAHRYNDGSLTVKEAIKTLSGHGLVIKSNYGEFRVNFKGGREETAYYTNDLMDAVHTGLSMARQRDKLGRNCSCPSPSVLPGGKRCGTCGGVV